MHGGDGLKTVHAKGGEIGSSPEGAVNSEAGLGAYDVLHAWRDFECSFFPGALLCPKIPFRRFLTPERYLSVGVDLAPALRSNGLDAAEIIASITTACLSHHGEATIPAKAAKAINAIVSILGIAWLEEALTKPARIICPRSSNCPRTDRCDAERGKRARDIADVRRQIMDEVQRVR
ncbi:MAG: DUF3612 domain-containing protein [Steroidobacteraceae bacterium]